jgi:hypothetical protein
MFISSDNTAPSADPAVEYFKKVYRYGMLVVLLPLMAFNVHTLMNLPPDYPYDRYNSLVVTGMLLFNHVAFWFPWRKPVARGLCVAAILLGIIGLFYVLYK